MTTPGLMRHLRASVALLALIAVMAGAAVAAAQSPSPGPGPTSGLMHETIVSDDGRLTLRVAVGSASVDETLSAVAVRTMVPSVAAYELRPVDVTFRVPVSVTWQLDPAGAPAAPGGDLTWLGMAEASDPAAGPWAWLRGSRVDVVGGNYSISGDLMRFGTLIVIPLDTSIRGPEAIWGPGYQLPNGVLVDLDLTLVTSTGLPSTAAFSGDWLFDGGYPERIAVVRTMAEAERLTAVWQCLRNGETSLVSTFGVREAPLSASSADTALVGRAPGLLPAAAVVSVTFPITCGVHHPGTNG